MSWKTLSLRSKNSSAPILSKPQASFKHGDEARMELMNLVKEGKLTVDHAMQKAYGMGVASVPYEELTSADTSHEGILNFGVYWYKRYNKSTKCILHIDTSTKVFSLIHHGQQLKTYDFDFLSGIDNSDDSTRLLINLTDNSVLEIDTCSLEDKNRLSLVLMSILDQKKCGISDFSYRSDSIALRRRCIVKEGILEKKGRSAAFLVWSKRYVKILPGEMMYFKVGDESNENAALSILSLNPENTVIKKIESTALSLCVDKKEYIFRLLARGQGFDYGRERDDWMMAIQSALKKESSAGDKLSPPSRNDQEKFLKSNILSLNTELEQLSAIFNVIDAPVRACTQVKKVREIVRTLNDQIHTGLLSWTMRSSDMQEKDGVCSSSSRDVSVSGSNIQLLNYPKHSVESYPEYQTSIAPTATAVDCVYAKVNKQINLKSNVYVNMEFKHFDARSIQPDLPPKLNEYKNRCKSENTGKFTDTRNTTQCAEPGVNMCKNLDGDDDTADDKQSNLCFKNILTDKIVSENIKSDTIVSENIKSDTIVSEKKSHETCIKQNTHRLISVPENDNISPLTYIPLDSPLSSNIPIAPPFNVAPKLPQRTFITPNCKLKSFFWTKVPDLKINESIWKDAKDRIDQFDLEKLESMFFSGVQQSQSIENLDQITAIAKDKKASSKSLINPRKAQNLGIFLSGFKLHNKEIESKLNLIEPGLSSEEIVALKRFQPSTEEIELFKSIDINEINVDIDLFMHKLCMIENLNERLDILLTMQDLPELYQTIKEPLFLINNMLKSLMDNKHFFNLCEYILSIGNYLNNGTSRGNAYGFRLDCLIKLSEMISSNNQKSLLDFIVEELYGKDRVTLMCYDSLLKLPTDGLCVKGLCAEVEIMNKDLHRLKKSLNALKSKLNAIFYQNVCAFIEDYSCKAKVLISCCDSIKETFSMLLKLYGESPSADVDQWFKLICNFMAQVSKAVLELQEREIRLLKYSSKPTQQSLSLTKNTTSMEHCRHSEESEIKIIQGNSDKFGKFDPGSKLADVHDESAHSFATAEELVQSRNVKTAPMSKGALSNECGDSELPTRCGYLLKLGGGNKRSEKWDRHYFELTTSGYLNYSKKGASKLSGTIYLRGIVISVEKNNTVLNINQNNRNWKIKCDNALEALDWFNDIKFYSEFECQ